MADPVPAATAGAPAIAPTPAAVASSGPPNGPAGPATPLDAKKTAIRMGGKAGGRGRADGLVPGSPEAIAADKEKDAKRKRDKRAAQTAPLPSALGAAQAPAPGVDPVSGAETGSSVPWEAGMLAPIVEQLIPALEGLTTKRVTDKALQARLPGSLVKEIQDRAAWDPVTKKALNIGGPQLAAKWLNRTGISAENQPELIVGTAVVSLVTSHVLLLRRLDELIAAANPKPTTTNPPGPAAPAAAPQENKS